MSRPREQKRGANSACSEEYLSKWYPLNKTTLATFQQLANAKQWLYDSTHPSLHFV